MPTDDPDELAATIRARAARRSLEAYLETFAITVGVLQTAEALTRAASECAEDLADDGVIYAEVRFAPELHTEQGLGLDVVVEAVLDGFARRADRLQVGVVLTVMRHNRRGEEIVDLALRHRAAGVVGVDLAGAELGHPPHHHAAAFQRAARSGLGCTLHAGESAGLDSFAGALAAGAQRLGHGVRVADDLAEDGTMGPVAARVHAEGIPLELCPTSNVHTGACEELADHPIDRLLRAGFAVTVNTDNRLMSGTSLTDELHNLVTTFGWGAAELRAVTERAAAAAFTTSDTRERLLATIARTYDALG